MVICPHETTATASGGDDTPPSASDNPPHTGHAGGSSTVLANGVDVSGANHRTHTISRGPAADGAPGGAVLLPMFPDGDDGAVVSCTGDRSETRETDSFCVNGQDGTAVSSTVNDGTEMEIPPARSDYGLFEIEEEELELQDRRSALALNSDDDDGEGGWGDRTPGMATLELERGGSGKIANSRTNNDNPDAANASAMATALAVQRSNSSSNLLLMKRVGSCFFSVDGSVASDMETAADGGRNPAQSRTNQDTPDAGNAGPTNNAAAMATALAIQRSNSSSNLLLMKRVGSCFFSVDGSIASDMDTMADGGRSLAQSRTNDGTPSSPSEGEDGDGDGDGDGGKALLGTEVVVEVEVEVRWNAVDVLYHDVMMNVLGFLPGRDLAAFSETARRPNFDCFYYLQLQLERALLAVPPPTTTNPESTGEGEPGSGTPFERRGSAATTIAAAFSPACPIAVCGAGILSRLNSVDRAGAQRLVSEYRDSVGRGVGDAHHCPDALLRLREKFSSATNKEKGAACTFAFTMLGAAASRAAQSCHEASSCVPSIEGIPGGPGAALLGFAGLAVASRCAYAAKAHHDEDDGGQGHASSPSSHGLPNPAAVMARKMQEMLMTLPIEGEGEGVFPAPIADRLRRFRESCHHAGGDNSDGDEDGNNEKFREGRGKRRRDKRSKKGKETSLSDDDGDDFTDGEDEDHHDGGDEISLCDDFEEGPFSPDPYEHCSEHMYSERRDADLGESRAHTYSSALPHPNGWCHDDDDHDPDHKRQTPRRRRRHHHHRRSRKKAIGCVGAYARVLRRATDAVAGIVRAGRREAFSKLSEEEKLQSSTAFIDACASDRNLGLVRDLVRSRGVDVDGFYVGSDGTTETCGLHAAAFNGSGAVLDFLLSGVDELDPSRDGGMCDVDLCDANGWTALHFAAGADNVDAVSALASRGADLTVEASNGYTPYHWSERLSNVAVAEELRRLGADDRFVEFRRMFGGRGGGGRTQPLSFLANRFFSLIPTN